MVICGVCRRDLTLVAEISEDAVPGEAGVIGGKQRIERFWSRATGERDRESSLSANCAARRANEFFGGGVKKIGRGGEDFDGSGRGHREFVIFKLPITNHKFPIIFRNFSSAGHRVPSARRLPSGPRFQRDSWGNYAEAAPSTHRARD